MGRAISPHSIDLSILSPTAQLTVVVFVANYQFTIIRDFQNACVRSFVPRFFCLIVKIRLPWLPQIFSNRTDSGMTSGTFFCMTWKKTIDWQRANIWLCSVTWAIVSNIRSNQKKQSFSLIFHFYHILIISHAIVNSIKTKLIYSKINKNS